MLIGLEYISCMPNDNGMNWISQNSRLALYLRDGMACVYCGQSVEQKGGVILTLDHIVPRELGGDNKPSNLITACHRCNSSRGKRSVNVFCKAVAEYLNHGVDPKAIRKHIAACIKRDVKPFRVQARELIALRGSAKKALENPAIEAPTI